MMTEEEKAIIDFLKAQGENWVARKEIARKAFRRNVYEENPRGVDALQSLGVRGIVEQNDSGQLRLGRKDSAVW